MFIEILGLRSLLIFLFVGFLILWIFKSPYYMDWGLNFKAPWYWHFCLQYCPIQFFIKGRGRSCLLSLQTKHVSIVNFHKPCLGGVYYNCILNHLIWIVCVYCLINQISILEFELHRGGFNSWHDAAITTSEFSKKN